MLQTAGGPSGALPCGVGTRSALFLPVPHLACVVLDEEHDASFKQDESLAYQAGGSTLVLHGPGPRARWC